MTNVEPDPARERALVDEAVARAALGAEGDPRGALAEDATWLALMTLGARTRDDLVRLLDGSYWSDVVGVVAPAAATTTPPGPGRVRTALALILRAQAAERDTGAAERAAAALACVALGCADPAVGQLLQQGLAQLELLDIVKQIPVAARVRTLALEFRFRRLDALPARFVARVQDLLERLDREGLFAVALRDRTSPEARAAALRLAALAGGDARQASLLAALRRAPGPLGADALVAACAAEAPGLWSNGAAGRRAVTAALERLAQALDGLPLTLRRARGRWALVAGTTPPRERAPTAGGGGSGRSRASRSRGSGGRGPRSGRGTPS
jgi:hypothetical protein